MSKVCDYRGYSCQCKGYKQASKGSTLCICGHYKSQHNSSNKMSKEQPSVQTAPDGTQIRTYRDLMFAMAKRAKDLANMKMKVLRSAAGYGCDTDTEAVRTMKHYSRGDLIEICLTEEFDIDFDREFEE